MVSVHKSVRSLKRDGILLILFELVILLVNVERNRGIIFSAPVLKSIVLDFSVYKIINVWWAIDLKKWIADKRRRKFIWLYIFFGVAILLSISFLEMTNQLMAASVLVYALVCYSVFGIWLIMRCI